MTLGTIFTAVLIVTAILAALWALFKAGIKVFLFLSIAISLALALLPYLIEALSAIFGSGIFYVIIIVGIGGAICHFILRLIQKA